jgi:uncharacterized protein YndB with AHSA1/START domain
MTTQTVSTEGNTTDREIVISRVVAAPRELVWEAMTNPQHVVNWWGPRGFTIAMEKMEVRLGGEWKYIMRGPDGAEYYNNNTFTEVVKPERVVFIKTGSKIGGGTEVNAVSMWSFDELAPAQTRVTIRMVFETQEFRDKVVKEYGAVEGGKQTLERLDDFLNPDVVIVERSFNAPIDVVWRAITDPAEMGKWYFPGISAFKPEVGFEVLVTSEYEGQKKEHVWKVVEVVTGQKIAYSWNYPQSAGNSSVSWELFDEGKSTRLRLVHAGLLSLDPEKNPKYARKNFLGGWTHFVGRLAEYVEKK